jgi:hypothetical protein
MLQRSLVSLLALGLGVAFPGCGGGSSPQSPTAVVSPTPTPAPTPSPSATPPPLGTSSCKLPPMPECAAEEGPDGVFGCCKAAADQYSEQVYLAIRQVQHDRPELFDRDFIPDMTNQELVLQLVARELEQRYGLCAKAASPIEDEIAVKGTNAFSEQYDIIYGGGTIAVNPYGYTVTCTPARF